MPGRRPRTNKSGGWTWQNRAACKDMPLALFFGHDGERTVDREVREIEAKQVCARCAALQDCRTYAVSHPEKYGVYGGMNEAERDSERRRRLRRAS
jgi:WhiB family transcriptional regulator, redox-sensing transcriptional regulator